jgi:hypothetical protein
MVFYTEQRGQWGEYWRYGNWAYPKGSKKRNPLLHFVLWPNFHIGGPSLCGIELICMSYNPNRLKNEYCKQCAAEYTLLLLGGTG